MFNKFYKSPIWIPTFGGQMARTLGCVRYNCKPRTFNFVIPACAEMTIVGAVIFIYL